MCILIGMNEKLLNVTKTILKPLISWLIKNDIRYNSFLSIVKVLYFEASYELLKKETRPRVSQISILTGLHRKDVKLMISKNFVSDINLVKITPKEQIYSKWLGNSIYLKDKSTPKPLPMRGKVSFETLIKSISKDIAPGTFLKEAIARKYIYIDKKGFINLNLKKIVDNSLTDEKLNIFGQNLSDHIKSATINISEKKPIYFEKAVFYHDLDEDNLNKLETYSRKIAFDTLIKVNNKGQKLSNNMSNKTTNRFKLGMYIFHEGYEKNEK